MKEIKFNSVKEMVNWLLDNESKELLDAYGRKWKYENYQFYFKDIGTFDDFKEELQCLHLFRTNMGFEDKELIIKNDYLWIQESGYIEIENYNKLKKR